MSMSTRIEAFAEPDERWKAMKAVWDACNEAEIDIPEEVCDFFGYDGPDEQPGEEVPLPHKKWSAEMRQGIEIVVAEIPENVKIIRFYNEW